MIEAGDAALEFARGRNRADLDSDRMLVFALVRAVEVMGEAAGRISPESRAAIPAPWPQIVAMRNRLIHAYFDIDRTILWRTVSEEIPALLDRLRPHLPKA